MLDILRVLLRATAYLDGYAILGDGKMTNSINKSVNKPRKPVKMDKRAKAQEGLLDSLAEFDSADDYVPYRSEDIYDNQ